MVQASHQLGGEPLPIGVLLDQFVKLADYIAVAVKVEVEVYPVLDCGESGLGQTRCRGAVDSVREFLENVTPPQGERLIEEP